MESGGVSVRCDVSPDCAALHPGYVMIPFYAHCGEKAGDEVGRKLHHAFSPFLSSLKNRQSIARSISVSWRFCSCCGLTAIFVLVILLV
jgi:hypothetical protein